MKAPGFALSAGDRRLEAPPFEDTSPALMASADTASPSSERHQQQLSIDDLLFRRPPFDVGPHPKVSVALARSGWNESGFSARNRLPRSPRWLRALPRSAVSNATRDRQTDPPGFHAPPRARPQLLKSGRTRVFRPSHA